MFSSTAPDAWSLIQELFSDQPWVVFGAGLLSWVALGAGIVRASRHGIGLLAARDDLLGNGLRIGVAAVSMVVPMAWVVSAVVWGNLYQYIFAGLFLADEPTPPDSWFGVSVGAVLVAGYAVTVCALAARELVDGKIRDGLVTAVACGVWPGLPASLLTFVHRDDPGPGWAVASGVVFVAGFLVAPMIVAICVRLCSRR
ncbi:hypothetical protein [Nocardia caishijiensis]|uniref:Uncharacterized protein n=1 Tax=Nocardia caishijiensis TaxID=184756 RepID=A0ABQ6YG17_9NOCA|nr:hypothetical protein [Nocardia caishijiensis]KAF0842561.1 hypothetical protein FNL39_111142 [Nocardia caishijiensis]